MLPLIARLLEEEKLEDQGEDQSFSADTEFVLMLTGIMLVYADFLYASSTELL